MKHSQWPKDLHDHKEMQIKKKSRLTRKATHLFESSYSGPTFNTVLKIYTDAQIPFTFYKDLSSLGSKTLHCDLTVNPCIVEDYFTFCRDFAWKGNNLDQMSFFSWKYITEILRYFSFTNGLFGIHQLEN